MIIKHGFSETCDHTVSSIVSFGDVFRCTCLLEDLKGWHVTWITAVAAEDLLMQNHLIDELILADSPHELPAGRIKKNYHTVINLEKQKDWCQFAGSISAVDHYGFKDWAASGDECYYPKSAQALSKALDRNGFQKLQETLFRSVGRQWTGQKYVLGYQPKITPIYDIGLNNHVGPKWPNKVWPDYYWKKLNYELSKKYAVCWQQSLGSIRHYIDWLASCRLIVSCDSLGMHLCLGMKKKVVALFGPTPPQQVYMYGNGIKLTPNCDRACIPCFQSRCEMENCCMEHISVEMVIDAVNDLLKPQKQAGKSLMDQSEKPQPLAGVTS